MKTKHLIKLIAKLRKRRLKLKRQLTDCLAQAAAEGSLNSILHTETWLRIVKRGIEIHRSEGYLLKGEEAIDRELLPLLHGCEPQ